MATKTIAWETGGGYITLTYTGKGNAPISVNSDANESFEDRQQTVRVVTTAGSPSRAVSLLVKQKGKTVMDFAYTGTVQEVTLPPGRYRLQCWGAQGGDSELYDGIGSKGGYSEGVLALSETTKLYIFVGGRGASSGNGGWNGGGGSTGSSSYNSGGTYGKSYPACGGGATDIATVTSDMSYSSKRNNRSAASLLSRCIVAGGGAGASASLTEKQVTTEVTVKRKVRPSRVMVLVGQLSFENLPDKEITIYRTNSGTFSTWKVEGEWISSDNLQKSVLSYTVPKTGHVGRVIVKYNIEDFNAMTEEDLMKTYAEYDDVELQTTTDTSYASSNANQQGGGTSGLGSYPGTQNSGGGAFGKGKSQTNTTSCYVSGAGGGGWYGGGASNSKTEIEYINRSGGGSGFVNTAANASYRPSGYTGLQLDNGETIAGNASFPSPDGGEETGHSGDGYARITVLQKS